MYIWAGVLSLNTPLLLSFNITCLTALGSWKIYNREGLKDVVQLWGSSVWIPFWQQHWGPRVKSPSANNVKYNMQCHTRVLCLNCHLGVSLKFNLSCTRGCRFETPSAISIIHNLYCSTGILIFKADTREEFKPRTPVLQVMLSLREILQRDSN